MKKIMYFLVALLGAGFISTGASTAVAAASEAEFTSFSNTGKEYKTVKYNVDLECENCAKKVTENISFEKGVKGLEVSLEDHTVTVVYDPTKTDETKLAEAIRKLGYNVELSRDEAADSDEK